MAKKKLFSGVKDYVKNTEYVKEQKPKTVSLGSSLQNTYKSSEPVQRQLSERERAEKERSNRMRSSALVSIAKTMAKNNVTKKTTLPSVAAKMREQSKAQAPKTSVSKSMAHNALAPVSKYASTHRVTGGQGVGNYGFKTNVKQKALPAAKEVAEYTRKQQNKYVYTPNNDYRFDAKGNMLMKKDPISIEYGNKLRAGMPSKSTAIMSWRGNPSKEELKYRDKYGYTQKAREALDTRLNENMLEATYSPTTGEITPSKHGRALLAGHSDTWSLGNIEDTYRKQYGIDLDKETLDKIKAQRETANYTTGSMIAQAEQYAATRGLLGAFGLVGKAADAISDSNKVVRFLTNKGVKTGTAKAITALMEEMGIDQAASVPLNLVDAMKADGGANIIKRFGINQGLDVLFSGLFEIPSLRRNMHFLNGNEMNEAANAMQEGTEKISTKIGAKRHLDTAVNETGDVARQEAVEISNAGYHAGDLGKAESYFNQASSNRGTGHYGTGTYFGGRRDMFEGSSAYGNRPEWEVDFDGYNLYKPSGFDQGVRVHDNLAVIDKRGAKGLLNDIQLADDELFINKFLDKAQEGVTPSNIKSKLSAVEDTAKKYLPEYRIDEIEQSARDAYEYELARTTDENYLQNRENEIRRTLSEIYPEDEIDDAMILDLIESEEPPTLPNLDEFRLNYYVDELRKELEGRVPFGRTSLAENMENAQVAVKQLAQDLGVTEDEVLDAIRKSADKVEKEYPNVSQSSGRKDLDSEATLFMKNLGYEGVDVRGIEGLDNTQYGSVIYDLKPETRRQQIREGKPREKASAKPKQEPKPAGEVKEEQPAKVEEPKYEDKRKEPKAKEIKPSSEKEPSESIMDSFFKTEEPKAEPSSAWDEIENEFEEPKAKAESKQKGKAKTSEKAEEPKAKVSNSASDEEIDRLVREQTKEMYDKMSTDELQAELRWLGKNPTVTPDVEGAAEMGIKEAMDSDEVAQRTDVINEILAERGASGTTNRSVKAEKAQPKAKAAKKAEEPKAKTASKEEVFVSEEQVDKVFNDAIRKRSYRFETLRAYPRSGDMRIIIGDRAYDERGFRRLIREDLERTKAQVNEAINARAAKLGKQKASVEEPKAEPKAKAKAEEPKRNQVKGVLDNGEPKAKAEEDTRTWQEKAKADFYESSKNRAKDVKKGKIPSRESGEVVNAIKRLKETVDFSDIKDALDRGVKDGLYNRKIRHLDEEMDKAMKAIEEDPEKVINEILEYHPNGAKGADIPADAVPFVMKGYALCKWADQNGMKALKEDIAATMAKAQSAGGSVLRAGQVFTVMADSHTQRDIVADFVEKMQTKYAKRLGDHKLSVPEDLLKKLDDATTDAEKSKILDDISVHVWNQVPQSFFDALSGLRIVSMLANTTTMIRNVASNVAFAGVREVDKTINTMMEATAEKLGKIDKEHRTHSIYNHFSKENRKIQTYWYNDYGKNRNVIKGQSRWDEGGGALNVDIRHQDARHYGIKAGGGKKGGVVGGVSSGIEGVRRVTSWIMDTGDEVFLAPAYADAATQLMHVRGWGIDDLTPARIQEIREYATDVAQRATYRDPSDAAMALAKWGHWQKGDGGLRLLRAIIVSGLQPFKKTPINIGKRSIEYSPLGFVKGVWDIGAAVHAGDSKAVNKAITELSKGTTGTGLVVAGYLLAQQGLVNAKLPTDDEGYLRKDLGEQDYALTLNGKSRSLQWAAPGAVPILAGATLYDQFRQRGWNSLVHPAALVSVLSESTNPLLEMSFMQSYMDIADVTDDVEGTAKILVGLEQIGLSYAAQFIPTILGKIANVVDPVRRDTSSQKTDPYEKAVDRFIKKSVINKIPNVGKKYGKEWGSASLPAYIDYKGDEQVTEKMSDRIIENFVSPWYTKEIKDDPVAKEVIKVNKHQDENVIFKSSMDKGKHELTFDGKTYNLDAHEMEDYKKVRGKANYNNVKKLMNSAEYKSMSWSEKGKAMKKEEDAAKSEAKTEALLKKGLDEWAVRTEDLNDGAKESVDAAKKYGIKPKEYVDVLNTSKADLDGNGRLSQYEVYTRLEQTDYPTEVKDMFWRAFNKGWTSDKTNPYRGGKLPTPPDPDDVKLKQAKKEAEILSKAKERQEGSLAAKAFKSSVMKKATETASLLEDSGSSKGNGSGKRSRGGRRGGGSSKGSKRKATASEKKFANRSSKLSSVDLEKIYEQTKIKPTKLSSVDLAKIYSQVQKANKAKTPTYKDINVKGLTKSQKNALLKVMMKKIKA